MKRTACRLADSAKGVVFRPILQLSLISLVDLALADLNSFGYFHRGLGLSLQGMLLICTQWIS